MQKIISFSLSLILGINLYSQKEAAIWYFGAGAGLDFNSGAPVVLSNGTMNASEGSSVACDRTTGSFLFCTNGETVWGKNLAIMPNGNGYVGNGLGGNGSSAQSTVIVPVPCSDSLFYIFTTDANEKGYVNGLQWSMVDITLNGGNGDVILATRNTQLVAPTCEKLVAVHHANRKDVWVVTIENNSNKIYAYLVTSTGISAPVITSIGAFYSGGTTPRGYLKFSPDGSKLFSILGWNSGAAQLFDFDNTTGVVSNLQQLDANMYGASFSPNSQLLYTCNSTDVYQYDISSGVASTIIASKQTVGNMPGGIMRALQLGIDGKIYITNFAGTSLSVINSPNTIGNGCNYVANSINTNKTLMLGLPNFVESYFDPAYSLAPCDILLSTTASGCKNPCTGTATANVVAGTGPFGYSWSSNPVQTTATATALCSGTYTVTITDSSNLSTSTSIVVVGQIGAPTYTVSPTQNITCTSSTATVWATPTVANSPYTYSWTGNSIVSGATNDSAIVNAAGNYTVTVTDTVTGCTKTATVLVNINNTPPVVTANPTAAFSCITGTSGAISATSSTVGVSYNWTGPGIVSGATSNVVNINAPGTYTVVVTNPVNGCTATATVTVTVFSIQPNVSASSSSLSITCITTSGTISASSITAGVTYNWAGPGIVSGGNTATPTVNAPGTYTVTVTDPSTGCTKTATAVVGGNITPPNLTVTSPDTLGCVPTTINLISSSSTSGVTYSWSGPGIISGNTSNSPVINTPGVYTVIVTNPTNGCTTTGTITVNAAPTVNTTVSPDVTIQAGDSTTLVATGGGSYSWSPTTGLSCIACASPVAKPNITTIYCVEVTNNFGCKDTACVKVTVEELCPEFKDFVIPNVFSPNGDANNELFKVEGWEDCIKTISTTIYDRWGLQIATITNLNINWDGKKTNGDRAVDGTYYYVINITTVNDKQETFNGFITLLR